MRSNKYVDKLLADFAEERERLLEAAAKERRSLLDRIQHPEKVQVLPDPDYIPPEPPKDAAELAWIGQVVPDFVNVGQPDPQPQAGDIVI